jgi:uncharacterized protein GlcG (DUF336 family)
MNITLDNANAIVAAALAEGRRLKLMPLSVAVLDAGGHLVAFNREDRSGIMRAEVAMGKAWGALGMGISTRLLRDRLADRPSFQAALAVASGGRFVPVPGGVLIRDEDRAVIGAVGISGDTSDKDEACAIAGIRAAGLRSDPAEPAEGWESSKL